MLVKTGWQSWDRVCYILAYGSKEDLKDFVSDPDSFIKHREDLPIAAHDAVPVYLDISTGKILVSTNVLDAVCKRRLAKKLGKEPDKLVEDIHLTAEGASRGEKDRMTWLCRQSLYNYFKKSKKATKDEPEVQAPRIRGAMLQSILFVHCSTFCRLELICPETKTWLEDQEFHLNGIHVVRKKGEKVGKVLMKAWVECRDKNPELFQQGVLVWGSPNAYQNEVACAAHSELLQKEMPHGCMDLVDMFGGELTELMEAVNYLRNQVKNVIPPKQTAKLQPTDLHFSRIGKVAGTECKQALRLAQKRVASATGTAAKHESGPFECLTIVNAMHRRCQEDAQKGKVEQIFRKSGYLAFDFNETGMTPAPGADTERWTGLPLGGSNLSSKYLDSRFLGIDEKGVPQRPDWNELHELRVKQRSSLKDDNLIKQKGRQAWLASREKTGKALKLADNEDKRDKEESRIMQEERDNIWTEKDRCF